MQVVASKIAIYHETGGGFLHSSILLVRPRIWQRLVRTGMQLNGHLWHTGLSESSNRMACTPTGVDVTTTLYMLFDASAAFNTDKVPSRSGRRWSAWCGILFGDIYKLGDLLTFYLVEEHSIPSGWGVSCDKKFDEPSRTNYKDEGLVHVLHYLLSDSLCCTWRRELKQNCKAQPGKEWESRFSSIKLRLVTILTPCMWLLKFCNADKTSSTPKEGQTVEVVFALLGRSRM